MNLEDQYVLPTYEKFPFAHLEGVEAAHDAPSWTESVIPYVKSKGLFRCPSDNSPLWGREDDPCPTSYGINGYFTPNHEPYFGIDLAQITFTSQTIALTELADNTDADHILPMLWGDPSREDDPEEKADEWSEALQLPLSMDITRHQRGSNYVFTDGHAKWHRFAQTWHQAVGSSADVDWYDPLRG